LFLVTQTLVKLSTKRARSHTATGALVFQFHFGVSSDPPITGWPCGVNLGRASWLFSIQLGEIAAQSVSRASFGCSGQFEKSIATMPQDAKLQGSCCAPMDEVRYGQQIDGLKKYADIAEVPPDPYDIAAPLAHKLMGYYDMALNKDEQAAYDYAMEHSEMQGPCCCKCWRWKVYGGLGKLLIHVHHYSGQQLTDLWDVGQGCGGPADTKMH
jgi:hypothetical protein